MVGFSVQKKINPQVKRPVGMKASNQKFCIVTAASLVMITTATAIILVDFGMKRWVTRTTCEERGAVGRKGRSLSSMQQERGTKGNHKALVAAIKRFLSDVKQRP